VLLCRFLATLSVNHVPHITSDAFTGAYLSDQNHHCYCCVCEPDLPDVLEDSGTRYELPTGWCGFALKLPARAAPVNIWSWPVTYHGCKAANVPSILAEGALLLPGDMLMDGTALGNAHTAGGDSRLHLYTSPSVLYSELDIYTEPVSFEGHNVRIVLQCRQNPASLSNCGETIGWSQQVGPIPISPHVDNTKIECFTDSKGAGRDTHTCTHTHTHTHTHTRTQTYIDMYTYIYIYISINVRYSGSIHNTHTHTHTHTYTHTHTNTHTQVHTHKYTLFSEKIC